MKFEHFKLNAFQTLAIGFALIILVGSLLLSLPIASKSGEAIPYLNALFTATSATCVTGLVLYDTFSQFSLFGQIVIIVLIQIGGLGFMTIAVMVAIILGRKIGLKDRMNIKEAMNTMQIGGLVRLIKRVLVITFILELIGAGLLSIRFIPLFGTKTGIWLSIFHSISAFCNAGFDLMGITQPNASLAMFVGDPLVNFVIIGLVILGGIGFIVWNDVYEHKYHIKKFQLHSKIVLVGTMSLIFIGTILFAFMEWNHAFSEWNVPTKLLASLFCAVTPRTAGFSTINVALLSEGGSALTMLLMLIGAGSGSTAGGLKVTTFFVIFLSAIAYIRGKDDLKIFGRRIDPIIIKRAFNATIVYLFIVASGFFMLLIISNLPFHDVLFESLSAIGTVGLSRGITTQLASGGKWIIIFLMYAGRVGSMSIAMAFIEKKQIIGLRKPMEKIIIG